MGAGRAASAGANRPITRPAPSLGLIDYPNAGQVQAQRVLFLEGAA